MKESHTHYYCDRCEKEVDDYYDLVRVKVSFEYKYESDSDKKEICKDCMKELGFEREYRFINGFGFLRVLFDWDALKKIFN